MTYVSIHGDRLGLTEAGVLRVDGKDFKGAIPTLGKDIFVDSVTGVDTSDGLTPDRALATLDAAFNLCTADKGYQIFVLPLHAETITGAAGIAHDVAGVSVYGLGRGGQRPTFLMDASDAVTYKISANDAKVSNLILKSGFLNVVTAIDVQIATWAWIDRIQFTNNTTSENFLTCIKSGTTTDNQCDGLKVTNCKWLQIDAGSLEFIEILGDLDHLWVTDNHIQHEGTGVGSLITMTAGDDLAYAVIMRNFVRTKDNASVVGILTSNQTDSTGIIADNLVAGLDVAGEVIATGENTGMYNFRNFTTPGVTLGGYELPAVDS